MKNSLSNLFVGPPRTVKPIAGEALIGAGDRHMYILDLVSYKSRLFQEASNLR